MPREVPEPNPIARLAIGSARRPVPVLLAVLVLTSALGYGATKLHTDVDVTDALPRGDPNTDSAKNLTARFKSAYTQQVSFVVRADEALCERDNARLPDRQVEADCADITDEVYIRAMDEMQRFVTALPGSPFEHVIGAHSFYRLINWTVAGGQNATEGEAAFALPPPDAAGEARYAVVHELVWAAIPETITAPMDPSREVYTNLYLVEPKEDLSLRDIGAWAFRARDAYLAAVAAGQTEWTVFGPDNPPLFFVDIPVANAHSSDLVRDDLLRLLPVIVGFFAVALLLAFRSGRGIAMAASLLGVAAVWVYGALGWAGVALNTLNLAVVPLILGVGIDYAIHIITEYQAHRSEGHPTEAAFALTGERAGAALLVATLTTIAGLAVLALSPSALIGQVGLLSALAMAAIFLLALTLLPALVAITGAERTLGKAFRPSRLMPAVGELVTRFRGIVAVIVVAVTVVAALQAQGLAVEAFGEPGKNFPADDPVRVEHEAAIRDFYDLQPGQQERKTNVLVFEGDMADPAVHHYIDAVQEALRGRPGLDLNTSRNLPFMMRTWLTVKDGAPSVARTLGHQELAPVLGQLPPPPGELPPELPALPRELQAQTPYPATREELLAELDAMFASPLATFGGLFVDAPEYTISVMTFATETGSYEVARDAWEQVWAAVGSVEAQRPPGVKVAFVGNTATNYLFIEQQLPWVGYLSVASVVAAAALVAWLLRDVRAVLTVLALMVLTSVWFLGALALMGVGLAITLVLPLVFISAVGSDYAVHMVWNIRKVGDPRHVYAVVGKSVLFSALTSGGAFLVFTQMQNLPMARTMMATAVAVGLTFVLTAVVVALAYPFPPRPDRIALPVLEERPPDPLLPVRRRKLPTAPPLPGGPARSQEKA